jgi:heat shock protein HtpX
MSYISYKKVIQKNREKTYIVLGIYLFIYTFLGLLVDIILHDQGGFLSTFKELITFKVFPIFTLSLLLFGFLSILISIKLFSKIQLSGEEYVEIKENNSEYKYLYNILEELKISARMKYMPKLYIIKADYMNAFASGWNEKNTLIAITTGLLEKLNRQEISAVIGHELTHIRNEDIKLTLVIGVTTNLMLFVVDWIVLMFLNGESEGAKKAKTILFTIIDCCITNVVI